MKGILMLNARVDDIFGFVDSRKRSFEAVLHHILALKIAIATCVAVAIFSIGNVVSASEIFYGIDTNTYSPIYSLDRKGFETGVNAGELYFDRNGSIVKDAKPQKASKVNSYTLEEYASRGGKLPKDVDVKEDEKADRGFFSSLIDKLLTPVKAILEAVKVIGDFFKNFFEFDADRIRAAFKDIKIFNLVIRNFASMGSVRLWGIDFGGMAEKVIQEYMWVLRGVLALYIFRKFFNVFDGGDE